MKKNTKPMPIARQRQIGTRLQQIIEERELLRREFYDLVQEVDAARHHLPKDLPHDVKYMAWVLANAEEPAVEVRRGLGMDRLCMDKAIQLHEECGTMASKEIHTFIKKHFTNVIAVPAGRAEVTKKFRRLLEDYVEGVDVAEADKLRHLRKGYELVKNDG